MEEFSLSNIKIELFRIQKNSNYIKLINIQQVFTYEIKFAFMNFLYEIFMDVVAKGNKILYINNEVIYFNPDKKLFKYHSIYFLLKRPISKKLALTIKILFSYIQIISNKWMISLKSICLD